MKFQDPVINQPVRTGASRCVDVGAKNLRRLGFPGENCYFQYDQRRFSWKTSKMYERERVSWQK